jgi:hypothetical protein
MSPGAVSPDENGRFCFSTETIFLYSLCYFSRPPTDNFSQTPQKLSTDLQYNRLLLFLLWHQTPIAVDPNMARYFSQRS